MILLGDEYGPIAVYPLYSSLPPRQQQDIFKDAPPPRQPGGPPGKRKRQKSQLILKILQTYYFTNLDALPLMVIC